MPRKSLKTASDAQNTPDQGVDTSAPKKVAKTPETDTEGKPLDQPAKNKGGRPSTYDPHIANVICIRIMEGESLNKILKDEGMPAQSTVYEWLLRRPEFAEKYARAREDQADTLADEILAIADEPPEVVPVYDRRTGELIEHKLDSAYLLWQKNRMDARKWTAMKLKPKKYGDKITHAGDPEAPLQINNDAVALLAEAVKNLELRRNGS
jgi:hypothetical protein